MEVIYQGRRSGRTTMLIEEACRQFLLGENVAIVTPTARAGHFLIPEIKDRLAICSTDLQIEESSMMTMFRSKSEGNVLGIGRLEDLIEHSTPHRSKIFIDDLDRFLMTYGDVQTVVMEDKADTVYRMERGEYDG